MRSLLAGLVGMLLAFCHCTTSKADDPQKFTALWTDGTRTSGDQIIEWHDPAAQPKLEWRAAVRCESPRPLAARQHGRPAPLPRMMIEMVGGDRLPGKVVGYQRAVDVPYEAVPGHLLVEPALGLDWPDPALAPRQRLRILTEWLRRIVWEPRSVDSNQSARYQPGTIFFRDGRQVAYRSLRPGWNPVCEFCWKMGRMTCRLVKWPNCTCQRFRPGNRTWVNYRCFRPIVQCR